MFNPNSKSILSQFQNFEVKQQQVMKAVQAAEKIAQIEDVNNKRKLTLYLNKIIEYCDTSPVLSVIYAIDCFSALERANIKNYELLNMIEKTYCKDPIWFYETVMNLAPDQVYTLRKPKLTNDELFAEIQEMLDV